MSTMIKCDKCGKLVYMDDRSEKGSYCKISIDYRGGYGWLHLCKSCYRQFETEFVRDMTPEEFDEMYGEVE